MAPKFYWNKSKRNESSNVYKKYQIELTLAMGCTLFIASFCNLWYHYNKNEKMIRKWKKDGQIPQKFIHQRTAHKISDVMKNENDKLSEDTLMVLQTYGSKKDAIINRTMIKIPFGARKYEEHFVFDFELPYFTKEFFSIWTDEFMEDLFSFKTKMLRCTTVALVTSTLCTMAGTLMDYMSGNDQLQFTKIIFGSKCVDEILYNR